MERELWLTNDRRSGRRQPPRLLWLEISGSRIPSRSRHRWSLPITISIFVVVHLTRLAATVVSVVKQSNECEDSGHYRELAIEIIVNNFRMLLANPLREHR